MWRRVLPGLLVWMACATDAPNETEPPDTDEVTSPGVLTGSGSFSRELYDEFDTVRFELGPPAIDACPDCVFSAAILNADREFGAHLGWAPNNQRLLIDAGDGRWQVFRSAGLTESEGGTWTVSDSEGRLRVTSEIPVPGYDECEVESGRDLGSPPEISAAAEGTIDCDTSNIDAYLIPMQAGETIELHVTAALGNDPFLILGDGDCIMGLFDDGLPCADGDTSDYCPAAAFTAPEDMTLEVFVEWYDCLPEGMAYELGVGGDITTLPKAAVYPLPDPYWDPDAYSLVESVDLQWRFEP